MFFYISLPCKLYDNLAVTIFCIITWCDKKNKEHPISTKRLLDLAFETNINYKQRKILLRLSMDNEYINSGCLVLLQSSQTVHIL